MEEIIFASGSVPVAVAARVYGKDASWIRAGIVSGWLPIGKSYSEWEARYEFRGNEL